MTCKAEREWGVARTVVFFRKKMRETLRIGNETGALFSSGTGDDGNSMYKLVLNFQVSIFISNNFQLLARTQLFYLV